MNKSMNKSMNIGKAEAYLKNYKEKELKGGKSGAAVYDIEGSFVLKHVQREKIGSEAFEAYRREAMWYQYVAQIPRRFLPEVYELQSNDEEIKILMKKYQVLSREGMDADLLRKIMEALAGVHTMEVPTFLRKDWQKPKPLTEEQIAAATEGWLSVLQEHPDAFGEGDMNALRELAAKINEIILWHASEEPVLNHGDFHWDNMLQNEQGDILICDWQGVSVGQASGDLSFFFSRLRGDGITLNEKETVSFYEQAVKELSGRIVTWETINDHMHAANQITSFMFWHQYLHNSAKERVQEIYGKMVTAMT